MLKEHKKWIVVTTILTLLPMAVGLILWNRLPDTMATHFDFGGDPNGWSSKVTAVFGIPAFLAVMQLVCALVTAADPKKQNISPTVYKAVLCIVPAASWVCCFSAYASALMVKQNPSVTIGMLLGILFLILGVLLPNLSRNYTVGIKLPWTLHSENNWNCTHRMAGKLWIVCGVGFLLNTFFNPYAEIGMKGLIGIVIFVPCIYSFLLYRKENKTL